MANYTAVIRKDFHPKFRSLFDDINARKDKSFFRPTGTQVYCGTQGNGKTISAVKHLHDLAARYPQAIIVSNIDLKYFEPMDFNDKEELIVAVETIKTQAKRFIERLRAAKQKQPKKRRIGKHHAERTEHDDPKLFRGSVDTDLQQTIAHHQKRFYVRFSDMEQLSLALVNVNNGKYGVIYVVDEIHTYFNALDSKNIPMFVFTEISQQRKQRKVIVGTSQLFNRMAKPFREQCDSLIMCKTILGFITLQRAYDGMELTTNPDGSLSGSIKKLGWFFQTRKIRESFDTFQKVVSGAEQYEETTRLELVNKKGKKLSIS